MARENILMVTGGQGVPFGLRASQLSMITRILIWVAALMIVLTGVLTIVAKRAMEGAMFTEIDAQVQQSQNVLRLLVQQKGQPAIVNGKLAFGDWIANDDNSIVDTIKERTGSTATLFQRIDGKQI